MEKDYFYLTYHQVMILLYRIEELKSEHPYFNDAFADSFVNIALTKAEEIALSSQIQNKNQEFRITSYTLDFFI